MAKSQKQVFLRGNTWTCVVYIGRDEQTGKKKYKWFSGFSTRKEAERKRIEVLKQIQDGTYIDEAPRTLQAFLAEWLETTSIAPKTRERYTQLINLHIAPYIGKIRLENLKPVDVQRLYVKLQQEGRKDGKEGGLHPRTVLHIHRCLHKALTVAVRWGYVARNVCDAVEPPKPPRPQHSALTVEEVGRLLDALEGDRLFALYATALATGMREAELLGLRWTDVDLEQGVAYVRQTLKKATRTKQIFGPTKTHRSERPVALGPEILPILKRWQLEQRKERWEWQDLYKDFGLVFTNHDGSPISNRRLIEHFKALLDKAGCDPKHVFHSLRHTKATISLIAGIAPKTVSDGLGHSNISITLDTYTDFLPQEQKKAAEATDAILFKRRKAE